MVVMPTGSRGRESTTADEGLAKNMEPDDDDDSKNLGNVPHGPRCTVLVTIELF